ncbi:MAG: polysaccharide deacetylase family protein [Eubacteriales bacterium]
MKKVHILCIRKVWWSTALALVLVFSTLSIATSPTVVGALAVSRQLPIYCVDTEEKVLSISFDAAWGNEDTEQIIEILEEYDVKATFFVVGDWVDRFPDSVKALFDAGHEIMNHSNDHAHYPKLSSEEIIADLTACNDKIEAITGVRPTLVRLPYGDYDDKVIVAIRSLGMEPIQWDVDSLDWKDVTAEQISSRVLDKCTSGSIVLFHNAAINTPAALPTILERLLTDGYTFCKISEIIYTEEYTIDHTGKQFLVLPQAEAEST